MAGLSKFIPARSVLAGGIAGLVAWLAVAISQAFGIAIPLELATAVVGGITVLATHIVPDSIQDKVKWLDGLLKDMSDDDNDIVLTAVPKADNVAPLK